MPHFNLLSRKMVSSSSIKSLQKSKKYVFKQPQYWFLSSRSLENRFLKSFLWLNFDLNSVWFFDSLSQKMVLTLPLKNLQKTENCSFQTLRIVDFELKVASKTFSKKLPVTKFWFKLFLMFCLTFPENGLNFDNQKFAKKQKSTIFKRPQYWFLRSRKLQHHFLRRFLWPNSDLNCF